jgi:hypothetical protein
MYYICKLCTKSYILPNRKINKGSTGVKIIVGRLIVIIYFIVIIDFIVIINFIVIIDFIVK